MGRSRLQNAARVPVAVLAALVAAVALLGCVQSPSVPKLSASSTPSSSAQTMPAPTPDPTFVPTGSAQDNKGYFDATNNKLFASNGSADGRTIIDNLVRAGFAKAAMQVTPDKTSINGGVDSILFSVKIGASCLLGQHGGGGYSSAVEAALVGGGCLVGKTRAIDW